MPMKQATRALKIATPLGEDVLLLTAFQGQEELSRLFHFELELISDDNGLVARDLVGQPVTFSVERPGGAMRYFHGYVHRFSAGDEDDEGRRNYRASVVPWLWFLTRTSDCRIFQHKTIPEIIEQIFGDLGFNDFETSQIKGAHPVWEYCVQYRETDFNFVSRLMEQEGIFYFFKFASGKHTLVLADQKGAYLTCDEAEVDFPRDFGTAAVQDHLTGWEHVYAFRSGRWAHTDYNFKTPSNNLMTTEQTVVSLTGNSKYEFYDYPGDYDSTGNGAPLVKFRMEEEEVEHDVVHGTSLCKSFLPGYKFRVGQHRSANEEGKRYVLTSVQHFATEALAYETGSASGGEEYRNRFTCLPDSVVFRPVRLTPKPMVQGLQTAVVTGPQGEEIYPDEYGRVKVQFFWDREGKRDENTSCWIRCAQASAGKMWGTVFIPRIGQEVLVEFLEGDPDRPLITGVVYNAEQMPHYALPGEKTKSYVKTNSSPGGEGFNEIRFEDLKDQEQIFMHAERNLDVRVKNDSMERVIANRHLVVGSDKEGKDGDQMELVYRDKHTHVHRNHVEHIGGDMQLLVGGVDGEGNQDIIIQAEKKELVEKDSHLHVKADRREKVDGDQSLTVGGKQQEKVGTQHALEAGQEIHLKAGMKVIIEAGMQLTIKGPGGFVDIGPAGVTIQGTLVKINSGGSAGSGSGSKPKTPKKPRKAKPTEPTKADNSRTGNKSAPD